MRPTVHVTGELPARVQEALAESFTLADGVEGVDGILSVLTTRVDGELLDRAGPQLRIVANYGVGVDNVDLEAARERNILVANTPDVLTDAVAELTIALTLALLRRVAEGDRFLRRQARGRSRSSSCSASRCAGRRSASSGPAASGARRRRSPRRSERARSSPAAATTLGELLETADVVSLHCPLTPETRHLIDAAALARMRPTSVLVNTARGPIVDEARARRGAPRRHDRRRGARRLRARAGGDARSCSSSRTSC